MNRYEELAAIRKGWSPPRALRHSPPRPVRLSASGIVLLIAGVLLFLGAIAAGVLLGRESYLQTEDYRSLAENGQETNATIVRLWRSGEKNRRCHVEYRFETDGGVHIKQASVPEAIWKTLETGGPLPVRYLPSNPSLNRPSGWSKRPMSIWLAILAPLGLLILAGFIGWALRRQMELLAEGRAAPAVVAKLRKVHHSHGGSATIIHYDFPLLSGSIAHGKSSSQSKGLTAGTVHCVLYDPNNPRRSSLYPLELVRVSE